MSNDPIDVPRLEKFGAFHLPSGRVWNLSATPLSGDDGTADQGCVAVAHHADGWVALADTKIDLSGQAPLIFMAAEWLQFTDAIREGRI